jgi:GNAT superfamily N-acetyltransferase
MGSRAAPYVGCEGPVGLEQQQVGTNPYWPLPVGILGGLGVAFLLAALVRPGDYAQVLVVAGMGAGGLAGLGWCWLRNRGPLEAVDEGVKALREIEDVCKKGYEILYRRRPGRRCDHYSFQVFRKGQVLGYLDADYVAGKQWLYIENVYVDDRHGNQGLATALLVSAARTTPCSVLTTSARTPRGVRFFDKNRGVLKRYGIEMLEGRP